MMDAEVGSLTAAEAAIESSFGQLLLQLDGFKEELKREVQPFNTVLEAPSTNVRGELVSISSELQVR